MLCGHYRSGVTGPYRWVGVFARIKKKLLGVPDKHEIAVSERLALTRAGDRAEFDPMYEPKRESCYGKRWNSAA